MTGKEYIAAALRTECPYEPVMARISSLPSLLWYIQQALDAGHKAGERQNKLKRRLFYDDLKALVVNNNSVPTWNHANNGMRLAWEALQKDPRLIRLVHSLLGQMGEIAEKQEALYNVLFKGQPLDVVNGKEEAGDLSWYQALEEDVYGFTSEEEWNSNIAKLRARYPDKFTEVDAMNRDLAAERKVLESDSPASNPQQSSMPRCRGKYGDAECEEAAKQVSSDLETLDGTGSVAGAESEPIQ